MSLTSYRAAPPRAKVVRLIRSGCPPVSGGLRGRSADRVEGMLGVIALCGSGGDRLSRALRHSTMGAGVFNGRVRDGIGFWARRSSHQTGTSQFVFGLAVQGAATAGSSFGKHAASGAAGLRVTVSCVTDTDHGSDQVNRAISTGRLNASPRLHPRPIDVVVFHGPQGRSRFKGGFPLRCLQRLSRPYVAMLHCRWRDNSSTRGTFIPVLSY